MTDSGLIMALKHLQPPPPPPSEPRSWHSSGRGSCAGCSWHRWVENVLPPKVFTEGWQSWLELSCVTPGLWGTHGSDSAVTFQAVLHRKIPLIPQNSELSSLLGIRVPGSIHHLLPSSFLWSRPRSGPEMPQFYQQNPEQRQQHVLWWSRNSAVGRRKRRRRTTRRRRRSSLGSETCRCGNQTPHKHLFVCCVFSIPQ